MDIYKKYKNWKKWNTEYWCKIVTQIPLTEPYHYDPNDESKIAMQYRMSDDPTQKVHVYLFKDEQTLTNVLEWFEKGKLVVNQRCVFMVLRRIGDKHKKNIWYDADTEATLNAKQKQTEHADA